MIKRHDGALLKVEMGSLFPLFLTLLYLRKSHRHRLLVFLSQERNRKLSKEKVKETNDDVTREDENVEELETMEHDDLVSRINSFSALAKERELSEEETEEREKYRGEYLRRIRINLRSQLNTIRKN